jgi:hypothetical protein
MLGRTRIALLAGVFAIGIAGCGGDDGTIPKDQSEELLGMLNLLQNQIETGDCTLAEGTASKIDEAVGNLSNEVDPEVQDALNKGAEHLAQLTPEQCVEGGATGAEGAQTTDTTDAETSTEITTTTSSSTTTEATSTEEDTTEPPPTGTPPGHETPPGGGNAGGPRGEGDQGGPASGGIVPPGGGKR